MRRLAPAVLLLTACSTAALGDTEGGTTGVSGVADTGEKDSLTAPTTSSNGTSDGVTTAETATEGLTATGAETGDVMGEDYAEPGANPAGNQTFTLDLQGRSLLVEVWYPADPSAQAAADAGESIVEFVPPGPDRDALTGLLGMLGEPGKVGVTTQTHSARDAAPADMSLRPLVVFSHCHNCTRFSVFTIAEHLASRGFIVAAPDHAGNTLFDELNGMSADIGEAFLKVRVADMSGLVDALLDPNHPAVPAAIRGAIDPKKIGAMGHSYGSATAGRLAQDDDRIVAAMPIFAPVENPFFPGTKIADIAEPTLFALAVEDNSILQIGNDLIGANFKAAATPSRLLTIKDAGHWGVTDICGLVPGFDPGCGPGKRMTDGTDFTYLAPSTVRAAVGAYAAAFFDLYLRGNQDAALYLGAAQPAEFVEVDSRL